MRKRNILQDILPGRLDSDGFGDSRQGQLHHYRDRNRCPNVDILCSYSKTGLCSLNVITIEGNIGEAKHTGRIGLCGLSKSRERVPNFYVSAGDHTSARICDTSFNGSTCYGLRKHHRR